MDYSVECVERVERGNKSNHPRKNTDKPPVKGGVTVVPEGIGCKECTEFEYMWLGQKVGRSGPAMGDGQKRVLKAGRKGRECIRVN